MVVRCGAKAVLPRLLSVEVHGDQAGVAEQRVYALAIRRRGLRKRNCSSSPGVRRSPGAALAIPTAICRHCGGNTGRRVARRHRPSSRRFDLSRQLARSCRVRAPPLSIGHSPYPTNCPESPSLPRRLGRKARATAASNFFASPCASIIRNRLGAQVDGEGQHQDQTKHRAPLCPFGYMSVT